MQKTLPEGWQWVKLGEVTNFIDYRGKTPKKSEVGIPLITAKNVKKGYISEEPREYIDEVTFKEWMKRGLPKKGDVLFTTEAPLGNVAQIETDNKIALAQRIITLQPNKEILSASFLKHALLCIKVQKAIYIKATGSTARGIKASTLKQILIPLPSLPTQHKIVEILEEAGSLRKLRQQADEKMKDLIPSLFVQMFGDPAKNPKDWRIKNLGDISKRIASQILPTNYPDTEFFYIGLEHIESNTGILINANHQKGWSIKSNKNKFDTGDILYGKLRPYLNKVWLADRSGICSTDIWVLRPMKDKTNGYFIATFLKFQQIVNILNLKTEGANLPRVKSESFDKINIPLPPLPLQHEFAKLVEDIEAEKTRQAESMKKLDELFNSLMQRAFTGKLVA